jgi:ATP-dependent Lon protease
MRKESLVSMVSKHIDLSENFKIRDEKSVKKIMSGLLKLLFPNKTFDKKDIEKIANAALEYRQRVRDWLHKINPGEFPKERLTVTVRT